MSRPHQSGFHESFPQGTPTYMGFGCPVVKSSGPLAHQLELTVPRSPCNLYHILERAGKLHGDHGILYLEGVDEDTGRDGEYFQTYSQLLNKARNLSFALRLHLRKMLHKKTTEWQEPVADTQPRESRVVVLHLNGYRESLIWFWACVVAGCVPVISLPFKGDAKNHAKYVNHIRELFDEPLIITNPNLKRLFGQSKGTTIKLYTTEDVENVRAESDRVERVIMDFEEGKNVNVNGVRVEDNVDACVEYIFPGTSCQSDDLACIMLTSGSTGNAKGVKITHGMVLNSIEGKSKLHATDRRDVFMSWTEPSHVANLIEIHIHAMALGANQVQTKSDSIIAEPMTLLELVSKHRVSYTFAPNFLLTSLVRALEADKEIRIDDRHIQQLEELDLSEVVNYMNSRGNVEVQEEYSAPNSPHESLSFIPDALIKPWDLSCLRALISGGETNVVATCVQLTDMLQIYGAPCAFVRPGFGMTETCAGSVYSLTCPTSDVEHAGEYAHLGRPTEHLKMRVMIDGMNAQPGECGRLELSGGAVFTGYFNNRTATEECFTKDGWFVTGDNALIDKDRNLHIVGRQKDVICINGTNHHPQAIELTIESADISGIKASWVAVFSFRPEVRGNTADTEQMVVVYVPNYLTSDVKTRVETLTAISKTVVLFTGIRPSKVLPVPEVALNKSVLGKLSRSQVKNVYLQGGYLQYEKQDERLIAQSRKGGVAARSLAEHQIIRSFNKVFSTSVSDIGVDTCLFELGVSSVDLLRLRMQLQKDLGVDKLPISHFFTYPTIRELAAALDDTNTATRYTPVVVLRPKTAATTKTPLFLVHPGMGEVLAFMNLARYITDRPIYAFRARGFDGEDFFESFEEIFQVYQKALKEHQPQGPYALAGYSWGAMIAFEISKRLIKEGEEVKMLVTFDMNPFSKERARTYDWHECLVSVAFFHGIMNESHAVALLPEYRKLTREQLLTDVIKNAPPGKLAEMGMDRTKLERWGDLALNLKRIVWDYDPEGTVPQMDILYTEPLLGTVAAKSTEEWRKDFIGKWDLLVEKPVYHFVEGGHRAMLNPPHVVSLQKKLKVIMKERGV